MLLYMPTTSQAVFSFDTVPPLFEQHPVPLLISKRERAQEKQRLSILTKAELIREVSILSHERKQLQTRVIDDAQQLQSRALQIPREWSSKVQ
jgi:hypothetical protein